MLKLAVINKTTVLCYHALFKIKCNIYDTNNW